MQARDVGEGRIQMKSECAGKRPSVCNRVIGNRFLVSSSPFFGLPSPDAKNFQLSWGVCDGSWAGADLSLHLAYRNRIVGSIGEILRVGRAGHPNPERACGAVLPNLVVQGIRPAKI